ncbi:beta-lactamase family protein [Nonomuraea sp. PA05]|uniref:serine hydrolase domain-containing protein n=1 Tax=Nonomuraea sp. PA05 TaxID=2604466 RepID=UPI0011D6E9F3|nr:serine hydrolase domain-containing protein [Nonomuraea sp. PA05]TYB59128.1 beta-lactamase family protein [Nonomuraea sp. PA05]
MTRPSSSTSAARLGAALLAGVLLATAPVAATAADKKTTGRTDARELRRTLDAIHEAGMYGVYSQATNGSWHWQGAAGVADTRTQRPVRPDMLHRAGSTTKTFTAVAVLQQVHHGRIDLDSSIGHYLPDLIPGDRGTRITVRMLLNHTSHIASYTDTLFPTLEHLDEYRFHEFTPEELVRRGLEAPASGQPGALPGRYSNTGYIVLGLLLEKVTGVQAERYITDHVIHRAGLRHTFFPRTPHLPGPHSRAYESAGGALDPPKDYSVYDMSWLWTAGALVSTMDDLNRFYRLLLRGELLDPALLTEMKQTVPIMDGPLPRQYGLGLFHERLACDFWGHDGRVLGMETASWSTPDGARQVSFGYNRSGYPFVTETGELNPIIVAGLEHLSTAVCGAAG